MKIFSKHRLYHGTYQNAFTAGSIIKTRDETDRYKRAIESEDLRRPFSVIAQLPSYDKIEAVYLVWCPEQALEWAENLNKSRGHKEAAVWEVEYDPYAPAEIHLNGYWTADGPGEDGKNWIACKGYEIERLTKDIEPKFGISEEIRFFGKAIAVKQIL